MSHQATSTPANLTETYPYAKAVGRFTNGSVSGKTGWIAPNGAIVTSDGAYNDHQNSYDVIEFNVPPSVGTTVSHPSPQDQYPLLIRTLPHSDQLYFKNDGTIYAGGGNGWVIFDPQPNGTGLRPGERQQEYFRIATNPRNSTINEQGDGNMAVDIFHYGETGSDYLVGSTTYQTLRLAQTYLLPQNSYLTLDSNGDRDRFVLYNLPSWGVTDAGAPVTFAGTNVAIGVHREGNNLNLGNGRGFRDDVLRNELNDFYASNSVYVDFDGPPGGATGEIHKPYLSAQEAADNAPSGAQVYIARNTYLGPVTFNRPMTLRAPVGKVTLGANQVAARKAAGPTIPPHWLDEGPSSSYDRESAEDRRVQAYPNPFKEQTDIKYPFAEGGPVTVRIFNMAGVPVAAFTPNHAASGQNGVQWNGTDQNGTPVPAGLYLVKVNCGNQTFTTKVLKN
jgi:FlgD Ig-like domain